MSKNIGGKELKDMYASDDREYYAKMLILPYVEQKILQREHIKDITAEELQEGLRMALENIGDSEKYENSFGNGELSKYAVMDC